MKIRNRRKVISIDLDQTVVFNRVFPPSVLRAFKKLLDDGYKIILNSGRHSHMMVPFYQQIGLSDPIISSDGALIHVPDGETIASTPIPWDHYSQILRLAGDLKITCINHGRTGVYWSSRHYWHPLAEGHILELGEACCHVSLQDMDSTQPWYKLILFSGIPDELTNFVRSLPSQFQLDFTSHVPEMVELIPRGVNKGYGLVTLCNKLGIDPADVISIGDGQNDISAFLVSYGIAMPYGHPDLLNVARWIPPFTKRREDNFELIVDCIIDYRAFDEMEEQKERLLVPAV